MRRPGKRVIIYDNVYMLVRNSLKILQINCGNNLKIRLPRLLNFSQTA